MDPRRLALALVGSVMLAGVPVAGGDAGEPGEPGVAGAGCSLGSGTLDLAEGVPVAGVLTGSSAACEFRFVPSLAGDSAVVSVGASQGHAVAYVKVGAPARSYFNDCAAWSPATPNACAAPLDDPVPVFVRVEPQGPVAGPVSFEVRATTVNACSLGRGFHALTPGAALEFHIAAPTPAVWGACRFTMPAGASVDLVQFTSTTGAAHSLAVWDAAAGPVFSFVATCDGSLQRVCRQANNWTTTYQGIVRGAGAFRLLGEGIVLPSLGVVPTTADPGAPGLFKVLVTPAQASLGIALAGDAALVVSKGELPGRLYQDYACQPMPHLGAASCSYSDTLSGTLPHWSQTLGPAWVMPFKGPGKYFVGVGEPVGSYRLAAHPVG